MESDRWNDLGDRTREEYKIAINQNEARSRNAMTTFMGVPEFFGDNKLAKIRSNQIEGTNLEYASRFKFQMATVFTGTGVEA